MVVADGVMEHRVLRTEIQVTRPEPCYESSSRTRVTCVPAKRKRAAGGRRRTAIALFVSWLLLASGVSLWTPATAQESPGDIPLHAHMAAGAQGWVCNRGFRQVVRLCVPDRHWFSTMRMFETFNNGWQCIRGYRLQQSYCVPVSIPRHALVVGPGDEWQCESGFRRDGSRCEAIFVPPHAHLDASGHAWQCDAGFRVISEVCIPSFSPDPKRISGPEQFDSRRS
jgi:hypothetical protein